MARIRRDYRSRLVRWAASTSFLVAPFGECLRRRGRDTVAARREAPMQIALFWLGAAVSALLVAPATAAAEHKQILIAWSSSIDTTTLEDSIRRLRINGDDSVSVRVTQFNFLHYSLELTIEERTIESYVLLERLWSPIFKLAAPFEAAGVPPFETAIVTWRRALAGSDSKLAEFMKTYAGSVALTPAQCETIGQNQASLGSAPMESLEGLRREALDLAETSGQLDLYERVLAQHNAVMARLAAFVAAADLVVNGKTFPIGKKKAGTVVSLTLAPVDARDARAAEPLETSYFVRSTWPLMLHVGYAASRLKDLEFDRVRSTSGSDLFLSTKDDQSRQSLATFMSYEFWRWGPTNDLGLSATLGTSFQEPAANLFVGGGFRAHRFVLTLGTSGSGVKTAEGRVLDGVAGAAGQRELYAAVTTKQRWATFAAVSIRVF
jgi:hypothetical protein